MAAVGGLGDLGEQGVGEGGLAGRGAARDKDIAALGHRLPQHHRLRRRIAIGDRDD